MPLRGETGDSRCILEERTAGVARPGVAEERRAVKSGGTRHTAPRPRTSRGLCQEFDGLDEMSDFTLEEAVEIVSRGSTWYSPEEADLYD